jgi:hypothetical protein
MTKASDARIRRRRSDGRPGKDDQLTIDAAQALRVAYGLGPQGARDLAVALIEGHESGASRRPRRGPDDWEATGFQLPSPVKARSDYIGRKQTPARGEITAALILALRAKDEDRARACIRQLALLGAIAPPKLKRVVNQLMTPRGR